MIGHVDRAWGYSIRSAGDAQIGTFRNCLARILDGLAIELGLSAEDSDPVGQGSLRHLKAQKMNSTPNPLQKGRVLDEKGNYIGLGKSQYDSEKAWHTIGEKQSKPLIKYDYLIIRDDIGECVLI